MKLHRQIELDSNDLFAAIQLLLETRGIDPKDVCSYKINVDKEINLDYKANVTLSTETLK